MTGSRSEACVNLGEGELKEERRCVKAPPILGWVTLKLTGMIGNMIVIIY